MNTYRLIALDMDGTLLNSEKKITEACKAAMRRASESGRHVVLGTGRCPAELKDFIGQIPGLTYVICLSGGLVMNVKTGERIFEQLLSVPMVLKLLEIGEMEDCMLHLLTEKSIVQADCVPRMDHFNMGVYTGMFGKITDKMQDLPSEYRKNPFPVHKFNLYHATIEGRERSRRRILEAGLPVTLANAEGMSLEVSPLGVDKGNGLRRLAAHLNLEMAEIVAVGDADNDLRMLEAAGMPVAMGNANANVRAICRETVADCDHDGCAEAIDRILLGKME